MIIEGILTTRNPDGSAHLAAMGPIINAEQDQFRLRPYPDTTTFANLTRESNAVFHITDDASLIAAIAIKCAPAAVPMTHAATCLGHVLRDCCQHFELRVSEVHPAPKVEFACELTHRAFHRPFLGFCRARHAVLEAAILATRVPYLPHDLIRSEYKKYTRIVEKTGTRSDAESMTMLQDFFERQSAIATDRRSAVDGHEPIPQRTPSVQEESER